MVREIVRDPMFLQRKSVDASMADMPVAIDLLDTLKANFEGCLSLDGERKTKRFKTIKLKYTTDKFKTTTRTFTDFTAQIIQHEIDHCNGILI